MVRYALLLYLHARWGHWERAGMTRTRLAHRVSYLIKRYRKGAPYWQFIVWMRLLLLTVTSLAPDYYTYHSEDTDSALVNTADQNTALFDSQDSEEKVIIWIHAGIALGWFAFFWLVHVCVQPYAHGYQNSMESWLFLADMYPPLATGRRTRLPSGHTRRPPPSADDPRTCLRAPRPPCPHRSVALLDLPRLPPSLRQCHRGVGHAVHVPR